VDYRSATTRDVEAIAGLHADSWRRNYRGAYSDAFLDADVFADRLAVWGDRLRQRSPDQCTIVAAGDSSVVGFAHTFLEDDVTWGALLDNLHVTHAVKRRGIGTELMAETARTVLERSPSAGLYLWVLEQNTAAQAFYEARGGRRVGQKVGGPFPGGGTAIVLRYAWPDPTSLLSRK
jgi:ribosomal protein S18 acetylase RimI-like enzyme